MDLRNPDIWFAHLLENLPEEKLAAALDDDNPEWEFIDSEIVKLGSLAHSQLDVPELQRRGLALLASESKDFRLLAHLLRTLQHTGDMPLALRLLTQYTEHYWTVAAPQNMAHKKRFALQVLKRFEAGADGFAQQASTAQRDQSLGELAKLAQLWQQNNAPDLAQAADDIFALYQRTFRDSEPAAAAPVPTSATAITAPATTVLPAASAAPAPVVNIDSYDDKAWRDTLLKISAILCERQPDSPQGYRLRRHALWQAITSAPQAESDGRTPLAAFPADMMDDYLARLNNADMALWQQVEKSVLLAPYWFDGHYLSAQAAQRLGYTRVADAIREETAHFLARLPQLAALLFNDRTPFIAEPTKQWLASSSAGNSAAPAVQAGEALQAVRACFDEQGLEAALHQLENLPEGDPRDQFYRQYLGAQLLEEAGMVQLARQQYRLLCKLGLQMMLADWEPSLLEALKQKFTAEK